MGRPHPCPFCEKEQGKNLQRHRRTCKSNKDAVRSHMCPTFKCQRTFASIDTLKVHIDAEHNNRRFKCGHCDTEFAYAAGRTKHVKLNHCSGEPKLFHCGYCNFSTKHDCNVRPHQISCTGKKRKSLTATQQPTECCCRFRVFPRLFTHKSVETRAE